MSFSPASGYNNFIPNDLIIPEDSEQMNRVLTDHSRQVVEKLNSKEIAIYDEQEYAQGQQWFNPNDRQNPRAGLRKVINLTGGLNDFTVTNPQTQAHGINITADTVITRLSGSATNPSTQYISLPFVDMSGALANIELCMDGTNVILRSTADFSAFTTAYVVIEFLQN